MRRNPEKKMAAAQLKHVRNGFSLLPLLHSSKSQAQNKGFNAAPKYTIPGKTKPSVTYKWNFSSQTGFRFPKMVLVRFLVLPTCTVTYGSLDPVLSLACRPWAHTTATQIQRRKLQSTLPKSEVFHSTTPLFSILEQPLPAPLRRNPNLTSPHLS